jgi:hypothetical protein
MKIAARIHTSLPFVFRVAVEADGWERFAASRDTEPYA